MNLTNPVLSIRDVTAHRGDDVVLQSVDLHVGQGEVVAITGPSGSGKSTLLGVISGLVAAVSGVVTVGDEAVVGATDRQRSAIRLARLGLVFQGDEFLPDLTLEENVSLPLRLGRRSGATASECRHVIGPLLARLGIAEIAQRFPDQVSGGQLQRAAIARAVAHRPLAILADEPTASLDAAASSAAMTALIELARRDGSAVVVVTHDPSVVDQCDRALTMDGGRLHPTAAHDET